MGASRGTLGRQERGKETRRNLIRTAARLWNERGFDDVTVEEICSEAGVGRTTFYLHFESKERLLASLAGATSAGVADDLEAAQRVRLARRRNSTCWSGASPDGCRRFPSRWPGW